MAPSSLSLVRGVSDMNNARSTDVVANDESAKPPPKFFEGKDDPALQPARDACTSQTKFWNTERKRLQRSDIDRLDTVIRTYEDDLSISGLENLLNEYLPTADTEVDRLYDRRKKGGKQVSSHVQRFAKTFSDFLMCYSSVVEIVKAADNQLGGVAVQTLSLFLVVAVNKSSKEELIESSLIKIKHSFPRLKILRSIYPTTKMRELIAQVYQDVLVFAQRAIEYYRRSAWTRVWQAISEPAQMGVQLAVDKILDELAEVRDEANTLLNKRVHELEREIQEVKGMLKEEKEERKAMQEELGRMTSNVGDIKQNQSQMKRSHSEDLLSTLQDYITPDQFSSAEQLNHYRTQLQGRFSRSKSFTLDTILDRREFKSWKTSPQSKVLVLRGRTAGSITPLSWLSNAAIDLVEQLTQENNERKDSGVVYHFCKREGMEEDDSMHTTISRLVHQLLSQRPAILENRSKYLSLSSQFKSPDWTKGQLKSACKVLVGILDEFVTMYLVIDRPECCRGGVSGLAKLLEAGQSSRCVLKYFFVVDKDQCSQDDLDDWKDAVGESAWEIIDNQDQR